MIYLFLTTSFEEVEALATVDVMRRAGIPITTVSMTGEKMVTSSHNVTIEADKLFADCDFKDAKALVIPGGMPAAANLSENTDLRNLLIAHHNTDTLLCAICAGPMSLGKSKILENKRATCYPGFEKYLEGAEYTAQLVETDGNIITGKGPGAAFPFALTILSRLTTEEEYNKIKAGMIL